MEIALNYTDYYISKSKNLKLLEYHNGVLRFDGVSFDNFAGYFVKKNLDEIIYLLDLDIQMKH